MERRDFLKISATGLAGLCLSDEMNLLEAASRNAPYSVVLLGDTHYDTEPASVYHSFYNEPTEWLNKVQRAEFARNGEMWRERCPRLMKRASELITPDTKMAIQLGDLIQGDCGNPEVHKKMLTDVMYDFKKQLGGLPFVTVVGNHDIRGTGAKQAYHDMMPALMGKEIGKEISKTTFAYNIGDDAYIVIDFNDPDDAEVEKLLEEYKKCRHTFIVVHGPLLPMDIGNARWFYHGKNTAEHTEARLHFRRLFAQRKAICLAGHVHRTEFADWHGDGGRITQLTINSVWSKPELGRYELISEGPDQYGEYRKGIKTLANGKKPKDETALFAEYRPGLKAYSVSPAAGSYKMTVGRRHIYVDFYAGDSREISKRFILR